jgi:hypothetical protein
MQPLTDTELHQLAKKRVEFRSHFLVYLVVMAALWSIWFFTGQHYMWPVWPMAGWGIGLVFHYFFEYRSSSFLSEEEEFRKLKRKMEDEHRMAH